MHYGSELFFAAKTVGIAAAMEQLFEYGKHIRHDLFIDGLQASQFETAVFIGIPPGQQKVCNNATLPAVALGNLNEAFQWRVVQFSSVSPVAFASSFAGWVAEWISFNCRIDTWV
jgi:hypothetical protein